MKRNNIFVILILGLTLLLSNNLLFTGFDLNVNAEATTQIENIELSDVNNANHMFVIDDDSFLMNINDLQNNKLINITNNSQQNLTFYDSQGVAINQIKSIKSYYTNNNEYILQTRYEVHVFNEDRVLIKTINKYVQGSTKIEFSDNSIIINSTIDNSSNIYLLTLNTDDNQYSILISNNGNNFHKFTPSNNLNLYETILGTTPQNELVIIKNNNIYIYNTNKLENSLNLITEYNTSELLQVNENILNIEVDYYNNIYLLTTNRLLKLNYNSGQITNTETELNFNELEINNITLFALNKKLGHFYLYNSLASQIFKLTNIDFSSGMLNFVYPVNIKTFETSALPALMATVNSNSIIFEYPQFIGNRFNIAESSIVIVLDDILNEAFAFILFNNNNKLQTGYFLKSLLTQISFNETTHQEMKTVRNNVKIFKLPTLLRTSNNELLEADTLNINEIVTLANYEIIQSFDNAKYYIVVLNDLSLGYVNINDVRLTIPSPITPHKQTNKKVFNISGKVKVYSYLSVTSEVIASLNNFKEIYIESYNNENEFTQIVFVNEQNEEITGYILTLDIWEDAPNEKNVTAIVLFALGIGLLIASITTITIINKKNKD